MKVQLLQHSGGDERCSHMCIPDIDCRLGRIIDRLAHF